MFDCKWFPLNSIFYGIIKKKTHIGRYYDIIWYYHNELMYYTWYEANYNVLCYKIKIGPLLKKKKKNWSYGYLHF